MHQTAPQFAIIGGGLSGLACLNGLVEATIANKIDRISITIFEPLNEIGPGLAYRTGQPYCWLLNHEADHMGTFNGGNHGFLDWINANREMLSNEYALAIRRGWVPMDANDGLIAVEDKAYYPRSLFGLFLHWYFFHIKDNAEARGFSVRVVPYSVQQMRERDGGQLMLRDSSGEEFTFDKVVLTSGHTYAPPNGSFTNRSTYFNNIYIEKQRTLLLTDGRIQSQPYDQPKNLGRVVVKGTGLSANDVAMWLLEEQALGNIKFDEVVMVSRRGQLRKVRGQFGPHTLRYLNQQAIEKRIKQNGSVDVGWIVTQIRLEMENAYGKALDWAEIWNPKTADIPKHLGQSIKESTRPVDMPWRSVMMALRDVRQFLYENMADDSKRLFFKELATFFFSYQAPMPGVSASCLSKAMEDGRLRVEAGLCDISQCSTSAKHHLTFLTREDGRPVLMHGKEQYCTPAEAKKHELQADYLIEALGQTRDNRHLRDPYPELFASGKLQSCDWGGIRVDPQTRHPVMSNGKLWENVWQLGINSQGDVLISTNAPNNIVDGVRIGHWMVDAWMKDQEMTETLPNMGAELTLGDLNLVEGKYPGDVEWPEILDEKLGHFAGRETVVQITKL